MIHVGGSTVIAIAVFGDEHGNEVHAYGWARELYLRKVWTIAKSQVPLRLMQGNMLAMVYLLLTIQKTQIAWIQKTHQMN